MRIGIDIGGTSAKLALVDAEGGILHRAATSTADRRDEHDFFQHLHAAIAALLEKMPAGASLAGIGVGAPSVNEQRGTIENAANLPFSPKVEVVKILRERWGVPVFLVKDSNASTLGELHFGAARGMGDFILLTLGTGLGCGVVSGGRLLGGAHGHAGEVGHVIVNPAGRACGCGRLGCLETYVSATGLKRTVFELLANTTAGSPLRRLSFEAMSSKAIFDAAEQGDALALEAFRQTGDVLGRALADLAALFGSEAFFLSGGLATAGGHLLLPTIESMEKTLLPFHRGRVRVLLSSLGENDAALLGAASLVEENQRIAA